MTAGVNKATLLWFTGLSGAGKTTVAQTLKKELAALAIPSTVIDGDEFRELLSPDLSFSEQDRLKNIERAFNVARLILQNKTVVICAFITPATHSPYIQNFLQHNHSFYFYEILCSASLEVCESRDVKGFYKKARCGDIQHFTGLSQQYTRPHAADLVLDTAHSSISACTNSVLLFLTTHDIVNDSLK